MKLSNIHRGTILLGGALMLAVVSIFLLKDAHTVSDAHVAAKQEMAVTLPNNVFDAKVVIPGTTFRLAYPALGFYEFGADVITFTNDGNSEFPKGVRIGPTVSYDEEKGSESVTLDASGVRQLKDSETLRTFIASSVAEGREQFASKVEERYVTINGREFYISKAAESVTTWDAVTVVGGEVVSVRLAYTSSTNGAHAKAAYMNNDQLFLKILSNIEF